jgi:hypothetical protein
MLRGCTGRSGVTLPDRSGAREGACRVGGGRRRATPRALTRGADEEKDAEEQAADEAKIEDEGDDDEAITIGTAGRSGDKGADDFGPGGGGDEAPISGALGGPVEPPGKEEQEKYALGGRRRPARGSSGRAP